MKKKTKQKKVLTKEKIYELQFPIRRLVEDMQEDVKLSLTVGDDEDCLAYDSQTFAYASEKEKERFKLFARDIFAAQAQQRFNYCSKLQDIANSICRAADGD